MITNHDPLGNYNYYTTDTIGRSSFPVAPFSYWDFLNLYMVNSYARTACDAMAYEATKNWRRWFSKGDEESDGLNREIKELEEKIKLKETIRRAIINSKIFGGCVIVPIFEREIPLDKPITNIDLLNNPVQKLILKTPLEFIATFEKNQDFFSGYYNDVEYLVDLQGNRYHISRISVFYGDYVPLWFFTNNSYTGLSTQYYNGANNYNTLINYYFGLSIFVKSYQIFRNLIIFENVLGHLETQAKFDVVKIDNFATKIQDNGFNLDSVRLVENMKSVRRGLFIDSADDFQQVQQDFSSLKALWETNKDQASAITGIPQTILFGVSAGGLTEGSKWELQRFHERIASLQKNQLQNSISLLDKALLLGNGFNPAEIHYDWLPLEEENQEDKINNETNIVSTYLQLYDRGIIDSISLVNAVKSEGFLKNINQDEIIKNKAEAPSDTNVDPLFSINEVENES